MGKYRISFLAGVATGFVLGARAGRERYDQLVKAAKTIAEHPAVQQAAGTVQAQAAGLAATAGTKISDEVRNRVTPLAKSAKDKVGEHVPGRHAHDHPTSGPEGNGHGTIGDGSSLTTLN
jgi:alkylation response protein AidB-like acyl-CoA dehydrogenase